jgi:hypothetical protein
LLKLTALPVVLVTTVRAIVPLFRLTAQRFETVWSNSRSLTTALALLIVRPKLPVVTIRVSPGAPSP